MLSFFSHSRFELLAVAHRKAAEPKQLDEQSHERKVEAIQRHLLRGATTRKLPQVRQPFERAEPHRLSN
jgi:hypothetical protein